MTSWGGGLKARPVRAGFAGKRPQVVNTPKRRSSQGVIITKNKILHIRHYLRISPQYQTLMHGKHPSAPTARLAEAGARGKANFAPVTIVLVGLAARRGINRSPEDRVLFTGERRPAAPLIVGLGGHRAFRSGLLLSERIKKI